MNLQDILFKNYAAPLDAPVTRRHYVDGRPMRCELGGYVPPRKRHVQEATARGELINVLKKYPGATAQEIADITGRTVANASRHMYVLKSMGMVKSKPGPYPAHGGQPKFLYYIQEAV